MQYSNAKMASAVAAAMLLWLGMAGRIAAQPAPPTSPGDARQPVGAQADDPAFEPVRIDIESVVSALVEEAIVSWKRTGDWPRQTPDFAQEQGLVVDPAELAAALGRTLHDQPPLDGYIKWQLLSFRPKLDTLGGSAARQVLSNLPRITNQPQPVISGFGGRAWIFSGRQIPFVSDLEPVGSGDAIAFDPEISVVNDGMLLDAEGVVEMRTHQVKALRDVDEQLTARQTKVERMNRPALAYRDAVVDAMPDRDGRRLWALLADAVDRLNAADPTCADAVDRFVDYCKQARSDSTITKRTRTAVTRRLEQMEDQRRSLIADFRFPGENRVVVVRRIAAFGPDNLDAAIAYLEGRLP
jgi:hypothetical protein